MTLSSNNIVEEGLQIMHRTKIIKKCLAQPRLLLRTFLLGMLLTGCFAVMADLGVAMASAQSLAKHNSSPKHHAKHRDKGQDDQSLDGDSDKKGDKGTEEGSDKKGDKGNEEGSDKKGDNGLRGEPGSKGKAVPVNNNQNSGTANNATGSNGTSGAPGVGGVPVGAVPVGGGAGRGAGTGGGPGGGPGSGGPGLPPTGSDPGNNPLP